MLNTHHFLVTVESAHSRASVGNDLLLALGVRKPDGLSIHLDMKNPPQPTIKVSPDTAKELAAFNEIGRILETLPANRRGPIVRAVCILMEIYVPTE